MFYPSFFSKSINLKYTRNFTKNFNSFNKGSCFQLQKPFYSRFTNPTTKNDFSNLVRNTKLKVKSPSPQNEYEYFKSRNNEFSQKLKTFRKVHVYILVGVTAASTFYYVIHLEKVPYSNRTRFIDISDTVENYLGSRSFNQIISTFNGKFLPYDHPYTEVVRHVASQIISVAPIQGDIKWEVFVINSPEINAFVIPGGKIFVFTGILPICRDADGLAAVLGHEIGHEVARHISEKLSFQKVILFFELLLSMFIDHRVVFNSGFLELAILNPFSRKMESEADYIGLRLCKEAGFSVYATVEMWERMKRADKSQSGKMREFLSTHPNCDSRIKDLKKWINELGY